MRHLRSIPFLLAAATIAAQSPRTKTPDAEHPIRVDAGSRAARRWANVLHDDPGSGTLWSSGTTWKASFGPDGFTFVPFFGSEAPRNFPVGFRVVTATVDGQDLALSPTAKATRTGDRVTLDRGVLREVYDLSLDHVEQSFVIDTTLRGDVHLTVAVTTDLIEDAVRPGLQFANELGHVWYGDAFVVVDGSKHPIRTTWDGASLHFVVPAALRGDGPVVIDPLVGTYAPIGGTPARPEAHPDVSFDQSSGVYLVVWENWYSAFDCDIFTELFDWTGAPIPNSTAAIDFSSDAYLSPAVANLNVNGHFLIVCSARKPGQWNGRSMIYGRTRAMSSGTPTSPEILISDTQYGNDDHVQPDVGGDPEALDPTNKWCVVWTQLAPTNALFRLRLVDAAGQPGITQGVSAPGYDLWNVRISSGNGHGQVATPRWGYAIGAQASSNGDQDVMIGTIGLDSGPYPSHWITGSDTDAFPSISSPLAGSAGRTHFLATFERHSAPSAQALVLTLDPALTNPVVSGPFDLTQMFGYGHLNVAAETDGVRFAVTSSVVGGNNTSAIATIALTPQNTLVEHEGQRVLPGRPVFGRLTSLHVSGGGPTTYMSVYEDWTYNPKEVLVTRYQGHAPGFQLVQRPFGCGGLSAQWIGEPLLAHTFQVVVASATPHLPAFVLARPLPVPVALCPTCTLGVHLDAPILVDVGSPIFTLAIPADPTLLDETFGLQAFGIDGGTCLGSLSFSDLFEFTIR